MIGWQHIGQRDEVVGAGAGTVWMGRWAREEMGGVGFVVEGGRGAVVLVG